MLKRDAKVALTIGRARLPYFVQTLDGLAIEEVTVIAKVTGEPASLPMTVTILPDPAAAIPLSRLDALGKLCKGLALGITLNSPFELGGLPADIAKIEELMLVVKYSFDA